MPRPAARSAPAGPETFTGLSGRRRYHEPPWAAVVGQAAQAGALDGVAGVGAFAVTTHTVGWVVQAAPQLVQVTDTQDNAFDCFAFLPISEWYGERAGGPSALMIVGGYDGWESDYLEVLSSAPSGPGTPVASESRLNATNDAFIDVEISVPGSQP